MKSNNPTQQWNHYKSLIKESLDTTTGKSDVSFVVLPEYALGNKLNYSEDEFNSIIEKISKFVQENNINLVAGSYAHFEKNKWYNRSLVFESSGNNILEYDKKHLFNFELKNDITPGSKSGLFTIAGLKVKILICSDLWFPEEIRNLLKEKIDLVVVPAMAVVQNKQLVSYGKNLWHSLGRGETRRVGVVEQRAQ